MKTMILIWKVLRPDIRQYKQQSIEVETDTPVVVEVPDEMVANTLKCDPNLANGIDENGTAVLHTLTLKGLRYVQEQFESLFEDAVEASKWGAEYDSPVERRANMDNDPGWDAPAKDEWIAEPDGVPTHYQDQDGEWHDENDWGPDPSTMAVLEKEESEAESWSSDNGVFSDDTSNAPDAEIWDEKEEDWTE